MPRKKKTPTEIEAPAEVSTPLKVAAKSTRKPRTAAAAPARKTSPRTKPKTASAKAPILLQSSKNVQRPKGNNHSDESEFEQIARLAYSFWEARGCQGGSPEEDWFRAEQEFRRQRQVESIQR